MKAFSYKDQLVLSHAQHLEAKHSHTQDTPLEICRHILVKGFELHVSPFGLWL